MPATFPLDFMDLAMLISPIRPGIGDLGGADKTPSCGWAASFDLSIDDIAVTLVWKSSPVLRL